MIAKRVFDLFFTIPGLFVLTPVFIIIAICIKLDSQGPIFYRQKRVGLHGTAFRIFKFRTMCQDAEKKGMQITIGNDPRITGIGRYLRKYKLDELPQLLNVVSGDMSLVGPRPEVPKYVAMYPDSVRSLILSVPPGITDYASIEYKDENDLLAKTNDPDKVYIEEIMPVKLRYYQRYVAERSLWNDLKLIIATIRAILY